MTTGRSWSVITKANQHKLDIDNECTKYEWLPPGNRVEVS